MLKIKSIISICLIFIIFIPAKAQCHVFPEKSSPEVGSTVTQAPLEIKIWFDGKLEAAFSKISVMSEDNIEVDKKDSHVDQSNPVLLEVNLKKLEPGKYHVYWNAISRDGHHTQGDFFFIYKKGQASKN